MITLRLTRESDLETLYEHQSDPIARAMAVFGGRDRESFMAHWLKIQLDDEALARTVVLDGSVAGNVMSWSRDGKRYVGYWIGREFWGLGLATAGLRALCAEILERPLYALVVDANSGSKRVLEKSGFVATSDTPPEGPDGIPEWEYRLD